MDTPDYKSIIAGLEPQEREVLLTRSDRAGLIHLAGHLAMLAATGLWIFTAAPGWQVAVVLHAVLLIFLFALLHECTHRTPYARPSLNRVAGTVCGLVLFLPYRWFTYFHLAHHRFTHDPDRDPELTSPKPQNWPQYIKHLSGLPVWWFQLKTLFSNATTGRTDAFVPKSRHATVRAEARAHIATYAALATGSVLFSSDLLIWIWLLPALIGQPFLRLFLLAEHALCPHVPDMLENTRTTYTMNIVRFLTWNMPYHTEHHCYPDVPFHQLPALHRIIKDRLRNTENGYIAFHRRFARQLEENL